MVEPPGSGTVQPGRVTGVQLSPIPRSAIGEASAIIDGDGTGGTTERSS